MRKLVLGSFRNRSGISVIELLTALGISSLVGLTASVPLLEYAKNSKRSTERQVISYVESDLFYFFSTPSTCLSTLGGLDANSDVNIGAIRRQISPGVFDDIVTVGEPVHPLSDMQLASITKRAMTVTGTNEGMVPVEIALQSNVSAEYNRTRTYFVKVFTTAAGLIESCSRSTIQDLTAFCNSFNGTLDATGDCRNISVDGNSTVQGNLNGSTVITGSALTAISTNIAGLIRTLTYNSSGLNAVTNSITGTSSLTTGGAFSAGNLVSTSNICVSGRCRVFSPTNCGASSYLQSIGTTGVGTCQARDW